ncbi:hypothetical protein FACS189460_5040 [Deltaproteobacteria bacterium]|nr:hypothetical protein FACS189460_5040 [Deltaproteobacteria bacterium]
MNSHIDDQIKILRDKKKRFAEKRRELRDDIRQLKIIPYRMRQELGPELTNEKIWLEIMPTAYRFLVEGRKMDENDLPGQLFFFDYDMFYRLEKSYKPSKEVHEIIAAYKIRLEAMWFERASVETVLGIMASAAIYIASSQLSPSVMQPGKSGTSTV